MQLSYRGLNYEVSSPTLEATAVEKDGIFLGHHFTLKSSTAPQRHTSATLLYRGIQYNR